MEKQQDRLVEEAKAKMQKKDKKGAMYCLKKKKMVQGQVDSIMGTMITLEQQKMALENAATCVQFQRSFYAFPLSFNVSSAFISLSTNLLFEFHSGHVLVCKTCHPQAVCWADLFAVTCAANLSCFLICVTPYVVLN